MALPSRAPTTQPLIFERDASEMEGGRANRIRHLFATGALRFAADGGGAAVPGARATPGWSPDLGTPDLGTPDLGAPDLWPDGAPRPRWCLEALRGRLVELTAGSATAPARLTLAASLVAEAQQQREPVAWICLSASRPSSSSPPPAAFPADPATRLPPGSEFRASGSPRSGGVGPSTAASLDAPTSPMAGERSASQTEMPNAVPGVGEKGRAHAAGRPNVCPHDGLRAVRPAASFFPPDFSGFGIDLDALALAALPRLDDVLRAADQLLRSGAFGLVVLDLERAGSEEELSRGARRFAGGRGVAPGEFMAPLAVQVRLANLCQRHDATLLCLTERKGFVLSGIRGETRREREREGFRCSVDVVKDKKNGGAWEWGGGFRGPVGLR